MTAKQAPGPVSALADSVANLAVDKHSSSGENPAPEQVQTESAATEITGEAAPTEEAIASVSFLRALTVRNPIRSKLMHLHSMSHLHTMTIPRPLLRKLRAQMTSSLMTISFQWSSQ